MWSQEAGSAVRVGPGFLLRGKILNPFGFFYEEMMLERRRAAVGRMAAMEIEIEDVPDPVTLSRELEAAHDPGGLNDEYLEDLRHVPVCDAENRRGTDRRVAGRSWRVERRGNRAEGPNG